MSLLGFNEDAMCAATAADAVARETSEASKLRLQQAEEDHKANCLAETDRTLTEWFRQTLGATNPPPFTLEHFETEEVSRWNGWDWGKDVDSATATYTWTWQDHKYRSQVVKTDVFGKQESCIVISKIEVFQSSGVSSFRPASTQVEIGTALLEEHRELDKHRSSVTSGATNPVGHPHSTETGTSMNESADQIWTKYEQAKAAGFHADADDYFKRWQHACETERSNIAVEGRGYVPTITLEDVDETWHAYLLDVLEKIRYLYLTANLKKFRRQTWQQYQNAKTECNEVQEAVFALELTWMDDEINRRLQQGDSQKPLDKKPRPTTQPAASRNGTDGRTPSPPTKPMAEPKASHDIQTSRALLSLSNWFALMGQEMLLLSQLKLTIRPATSRKQIFIEWSASDTSYIMAYTNPEDYDISLATSAGRLPVNTRQELATALRAINSEAPDHK